MAITPEQVHVTRHAVEQLLIRYPDELLPRHPEDFLQRQMTIARPLRAGETPWLNSWSTLLHPQQVLLGTRQWVLAVRPERRADPALLPWILVTVLSRRRDDNRIPAALREERLRNAQTFASGRAYAQLAALVPELDGRSRPVTLSAAARTWREQHYPRHEHGGFPTFAAFAREAASRGVVALGVGERLRPAGGLPSGGRRATTVAEAAS